MALAFDGPQPTPAEPTGACFALYPVDGSLPRTPDDAFEPSYLNFLPINGAVLVPQFGDPNDAQALEDIRAAYPDREIIGIHTREIIYGGGNIHCITQQQPKARVRR